MKVLLGGTFSILHRAHKEMISRGLGLGELTIGLTSDRFKFDKRYAVPPYETREARLRDYLVAIEASAEIRELTDPYGSTLSPKFDAIISSNETLEFISNVNFIRRSKGIAPLLVENVGEILADDLMPIKSERIIKGDIDEDGRRKRKITVILATENEEKIQGASNFFNRIFNNFEIKSVRAEDGFHDQPMNGEIFEGAVRRVEGIREGYDYAVGIEAGISSQSGVDFDVHVAAVKDSLHRMSYGISSGLPLNHSIMGGIKEGLNLEEITNSLVGVENSGTFRGAIYYLSKGLKERRNLVEESLISAFVQRIGSAIPLKTR